MHCTVPDVVETGSRAAGPHGGQPAKGNSERDYQRLVARSQIKKPYCRITLRIQGLYTAWPVTAPEAGACFRAGDDVI